MFQDVPCFAMPVETISIGSTTFSGEGCYSTEYDLHLYQVLDRTIEESGLTIRIVTEMYSVKLGIDPGLDAVKLPDGFVVQDGLCSTCGTDP